MYDSKKINRITKPTSKPLGSSQRNVSALLRASGQTGPSGIWSSSRGNMSNISSSHQGPAKLL